jgi:hypothetical protein
MSLWLMNRFPARWVQAFCLSMAFLHAQEAGLLVTPTRVVLNGPRATAALSLIHLGEENTRYLISLVDLEMDINGQLHRTGASPQIPESALIFSPSHVELKKGEAQTVRLFVPSTAGLAPGEYRVHLLFQQLQKSPSFAESSETKGIQVKLGVNQGVCIPLILRVGKTNASLDIADMQLQSGSSPGLSLKLNRQGNRSVYGHIEVKVFGVHGELLTQTSKRGLAIYAHRNERLVSIPLSPSALLYATSIEASFQDGETEGVLATRRMELPSAPQISIR